MDTFPLSSYNLQVLTVYLLILLPEESRLIYIDIFHPPDSFFFSMSHFFIYTIYIFRFSNSFCLVFVRFSNIFYHTFVRFSNGSTANSSAINKTAMKTLIKNVFTAVFNSKTILLLLPSASWWSGRGRSGRIPGRMGG